MYRPASGIVHKHSFQYKPALPLLLECSLVGKQTTRPFFSLRVWRYRGGRDETVHQFLSFLGRGPASDILEKVFPGVAVFSLPQLPALEGAQRTDLLNSFEVRKFVSKL